MDFRAARRCERDQILDLLAQWYGDREFFARYSRNDPRFRDELCLVAADGDRIVSTVQIFDRTINLAGQRVPMGGIGSVFTCERYRHRGAASALMRLAVEIMAREGFEVSLLFAERLSFYHQFGWKEVSRSFSVLANPAEIVTPVDCEIGVFDAENDLGALMRLHREYSGRFNTTAVRDEVDWRANLAYAGNVPQNGFSRCDEYFVVARTGGPIRAYARATRFHGVAMIMEYGYEAGAADVMVALFRHLGEMGACAASPYRLAGDHRNAALLCTHPDGIAGAVLVTHTRHDPLLERRLALAGCPPLHHPDSNYMWRVIMPERLGRRFAMEPDAAAKYVLAMIGHQHSLYWTSDRF
jgi:predicted N-acetyltransferase YhbS